MMGNWYAVPLKKRKGKWIKEGQALFSKFMDEKDYEKAALSVFYTMLRNPDFVKGMMQAMRQAVSFYERIEMRRLKNG